MSNNVFELTYEAIYTFTCTVQEHLIKLRVWRFYWLSSNYPPEQVAVSRVGRDEAGGFETLTAVLTDGCDSEGVFFFPVESSIAQERF